MGWFYENYKWLFDGVAGAASVAVIAFLVQRLFGKESLKGANLTAQGSKVQASPVASGAGISQVVNSPTINMSFPASPATQNDDPPALLSFVQSRTTLLHQDTMGVWYEASVDLEHARPGLIAQFKNRPSTLGQRSAKARSVTAVLVFKSPDMPDELHINHAVWLGRFENVASFDSGETHQLLVAAKLLPYVSYDNPNATNPFRRRWRSGTTIHKPQAYALAEGEGEVEITLIDGSNVTVFAGLFDYRFADGEMILKQR